MIYLFNFKMLFLKYEMINRHFTFEIKKCQNMGDYIILNDYIIFL